MHIELRNTSKPHLGVLSAAVLCVAVVACATLAALMAVFAAPTPPASTLSIDAYHDPEVVGFWLYIQDGAACDPAKWSDLRKVDVGMPVRSADGLTDEWDVSTLADLHATDCVQLTAYDAAGNESDFATVAAPGDNVGWFGLSRGKNAKVQ